MIKRVSEGYAAWRRLGLWRGTVAALRAVLRIVRTPLRRLRLNVRPLKASEAQVRAALGGTRPVDALRGPVLKAMPTVAGFERELEDLEADERADLVSRANGLLEHRFDLLGSGPTDLGPVIDWQLDFKSGRSWPLAHISKVPVTYPDGSDIKVPWELSRFQHLPILAAAYRLTGERRFQDEIGAQLEQWISENPVEFGANWACTMDVAIRAANWVAALALCAEGANEQPWLGGVMASLLLHGRFIRSNLEYGEIRGNHYLSDVVGLMPLAALFSSGREGRKWADWAVDELISEMEHQVRPDGSDHEASIAYHRLVCELFVCGTQAADALAPERLPAWYRERLELMLEFVADYTRPDCLTPQIGDADSGRFLPLGDYGVCDFRSHTHLFKQAGKTYEPATESAAYPHGGYYVMRADDLYVIVRCGDVGLYGRGAHSHNDQLSFELALGEQPMVIDPGAYLYTADPAARNLFRSTAFHSTLAVGGVEQNDLAGDYLFKMDDRSRAEALAWESKGDSTVFEGRHFGFGALDPPAVHIRRFELDGAADTLLICDTVTSLGSHSLEWTFPLAPCKARVDEGTAVAEFERGRLTIEAQGLQFAVEPGWYSPAYGVRVETPFIRARRQGRSGKDVTDITLRVSRA